MINIIQAFLDLKQQITQRQALIQKRDLLEVEVRQQKINVEKQKTYLSLESEKSENQLKINHKNTVKWLSSRISRLHNQIRLRTYQVANYYPNSLITQAWNDIVWSLSESDENSYKPRMSGGILGILRIGEIQTIEDEYISETNPVIPALVPIRNLSNNAPGHIVIFSNSAESRQLAVASLQSIALRIISTFPIRKMKGVFIDPVGMGNNFPFNKLPDFISGLKIHTRNDDIREQLRSLTVHVEQVIQNYLGVNYKSIEDYNTAKSSVSEPYRYLFAADFPNNFDKTSWEDLKSLLINGSRAGVYVVLHIDENAERISREIDYNLLESYCTVLRPSENSSLFKMKFPNGLSSQILFDRPPPNEQFTQLIEIITKTFKEVKTETVSFSDFYPKKTDPDKLEWSEAYDSRREIRAPIGLMGAMENLEFWMGSNEDGLVASQALLAGKPGAGKSYTLHAIIISLAMRYSPEELEMYLLDFKEGVEFQIYVDPERSETLNLTEDLNEEKALPHAKVVSNQSDREFGLSVLKSVQEEIEKRGSKFKSVGVSNLIDYRHKCPQEKMPRILVVIDEFQYMFQERDSITAELNLIFEDITRRGRAFGVHLLIASQSPNVPNMSRGIYSFIELRMAQQMDKSTAASVLAEGNVDAVDLLEKPGKVIYNKDFGRKGHNDIGQVADVSLVERINALLHIQSIATERSYQRSEPLILFNGSRPTKLSHNRQLAQLSHMNQWLSSRDLNKQVIKEPDWLTEETPKVAWLGEAMRIGDHTKGIFRRRSRSNLLVIGSSEEIAFGILGGILLSLVHTCQPQTAAFQILDLSQDSEDNHWAQMTLTFRRFFTQYFPITIGKRFPDQGQKIVRAEKVLQNAYEELERRKQKRSEDPDDLDFARSLFFICAIGGLSRAQNLRPVEGRRGEDASEDAQKLLALASQGSELGIHTVLWLDNMKTWSQLTADNRSVLTHFDLRVGMNMPAEDSRTLLGEHYAQNLPRVIAYFCDKAVGSNLEKFKPYAIPSVQEMAEYSKRLQQRSF